MTGAYANLRTDRKMMQRILSKLKRDGLVLLFVAIVKYPFRYRKRRAYQKMLARERIGDRFSDIYAWNLWSSPESLSGAGSELGYTASLRNWLAKKIPSLGVTRFVDAPCGDFNWMKFVLPSVDVDYFGLDIVESVIKGNREMYAGERVQFKIANICEDPIPSCDLIMVRDCLFHLSYADISKFFENLSRTDYKYLLTTTHIVEPGFTNQDIITGDFRLIDLFSSPFYFNPRFVEDRVDDYPDGYPVKREMILLKKENIPLPTARAIAENG